MVQEVIVALIVGLAVLSLAWRWMPASWRRAAAARLAAGGRRAGLVDAERAGQLEHLPSKSKGCGACDSCSPACASNGDDKARADATEAPLIRMR